MERAPPDARSPVSAVSLGRLAAFALTLGLVGFGGGLAVAHRARQMLVTRRRWLSEAELVDYVAVATSLPGALATNVLTLIGLRLGGLRGASVAVASFLAPSVLIMLALAHAHDHVRRLAWLATFLDGMSAATVGVVAAVAIDMARTALTSRPAALLAILAALACILRVLTLLEVVTIAAVVGALALRPPRVRDDDAPPSSPLPPLVIAPVVAWPFAVTLSFSATLFLVFARIGLATFGGGFAMIGALYDDVVVARGWVDERAFRDAVVFGQVTPGPVSIAATFIGYRIDGLAGAFAATLGIFAPPFVVAVLAARSLEAFRASPAVAGILRGLAPAVVGTIAAAVVSLAQTSVHSSASALVAVLALVTLRLRPTLSPMVPLVLGGALVTLARRVI